MLDQLQKLYNAPEDNFKNILKENILYHIIVADEGNEKGIVKLVNAYSPSLPRADRLILAFKDRGELENIKCEFSYLYCTYPGLEEINEDAKYWFY